MSLNQIKNFAIIVAGGSGTRMNSPLPKQFHLLSGSPILLLTINAFTEALTNLHVILVIPKGHYELAENLITRVICNGGITITSGGATRFESVQNGLRLVPDGAIVLVHDGVRCMVTPELIRRCASAANINGNAVPAISPADSVRLEHESGNEQLDRRRIKLIQTPQTFKSEILRQAYLQPYRDTFTDDASVVEAMGEQIHLVEGESTNLKITLPIDLIIANEILKARAAVQDSL